MDWDSLRTQLLEIRRLDQSGSLKLESFLSVSGALGILFEGSLRQVSEEFLYLVDSQRLQPRLLQAVLGARHIPESFDAFGILLLSLSLREVKAECGSEDTEEGSWHTFRIRLNALPKAERRRVLEILPGTDLTPDVSVAQAPLPDQAWIHSWNKLCQGIPVGCFPVAWRKLIADEVSAEVDTQESVESATGSILEVPHMILSRERERRDRRPLGTWLFRLASLKELQNPETNRKELVLPDWVVPKSSQAFLAELQTIKGNLGGLPGDSQLRSLLEQVESTSDISNLRELKCGASQILQMASDWDAKRVHVEGVAGITHLRAGHADEARLAYMRMFNRAESKQDAAMALANLAGMLAVSPGGFEKAEALLDEALRLCPWSKLALRGRHILRRLSEPGFGRISHE
ncbi:MAG: tetratricopeptide repeat protein [Planctomycetota bacterium]